MKEETELAVVKMYRELLTRHLHSKAKRLAPKEVMRLVRRRYKFSRASVYAFINKHDKSLLN